MPPTSHLQNTSPWRLANQAVSLGASAQCSVMVPRRAHAEPPLACPFEKCYPLLFRRCRRLNLRRLRDVKHHIRTEHRLPLYCPTCDQDDFPNEEMRDTHVRARQCVKPDNGVQVRRGVDGPKLAQLGRRASRNHDHDEQWMEVWDILFPGVTRPISPLRDNFGDECIDIIRGDWALNGQSLTDMAIASLPADLPPNDFRHRIFLTIDKVVGYLLSGVGGGDATANDIAGPDNQHAAEMMNIHDENNANAASSSGDGDPGPSSRPYDTFF